VILPDVNVLVYAHREDAVDHPAYREWLEQVVNGDEAYGVSELVLSGFIRVVTHPKVFKRPQPPGRRLDIRRAGAWATELCAGRAGYASLDALRAPLPRMRRAGNLVPDAYLAAMAMESGCEWITADRDYSRFKGLRWRHPLR
jgi:toxin-antitoxin system PIN domain toxin